MACVQSHVACPREVLLPWSAEQGVTQLSDVVVAWRWWVIAAPRSAATAGAALLLSFRWWWLAGLHCWLRCCVRAGMGSSVALLFAPETDLGLYYRGTSLTGQQRRHRARTARRPVHRWPREPLPAPRRLALALAHGAREY